MMGLCYVMDYTHREEKSGYIGKRKIKLSLDPINKLSLDQRFPKWTISSPGGDLKGAMKLSRGQEF